VTLPNFICIGAQRAGTTWLHDCLNEHPEVYVPEKKELHFFNSNYSKGIEHYATEFERSNPGHRAIGEVTPNYYHDIDALKRMKDTIPDAKIVFIIREPVARSYSHYQLLSTTRCKGLSFQEAMAQVPIISELSLQGKYIKNVLSIFPKNQVLICLYDDLEQKPHDFFKNILCFLGVNEYFTPSVLNERVNRIIFPNLQNAMDKIGLKFVIEMIKKTPIGALIKKKYNESGRKSVSLNQKAYKNVFSSDVTLIEELTGFNLENWR
tara:strand:- start:11215 stop:12009 length:795 start_codon:yes stop_codon:yes gene_type:complete